MNRKARGSGFPRTAESELPVSFRNKRGQRLVGVFHVPDAGKKLPAVIMVHGFTDDKTGDNRLFVRFSRWAARKGIAVLRFDFAGSGDSEGDFSRMTIDGEIEDLRCAIAYAAGLPQVDGDRIALVGYSLGGAVSILAMARERKIQGVVGWAPAGRLTETFTRILGEDAFLGAKKAGACIACRNGDKEFSLRKGFFDSVGRHDPAAVIGRIAPRQVSIIQGSADKKVLPQDAALLFGNACAPKRLLNIAGAGHSFAFYEKELFAATWRSLTGILGIRRG